MSIKAWFQRLRGRRNVEWEKCVSESLVRDWRHTEDPDSLPENEATPYDLMIEASRNGQQHSVVYTSHANGNFGAQIFAEINRGFPCLSVTNELYGDNILHIFFTPDGIAVVTERDNERSIPVPTDRYYPGARGFSLFYNNPVDAMPEAVMLEVSRPILQGGRV